jgi:succinate dehydrogenase / fumarate reductase, cytochrome b subunit
MTSDSGAGRDASLGRRRKPMAQAESTTRASARPISPHLGIYSPLINMVMSIVHRITGIALYFGTIILIAWLLAAATSRSSYDFVTDLLGSPVGLVIMAGYTWALVHHALGGLRHLIWDTGRGFALGTVNALSWLTLIGSLAITAGIWGYVLHLRGLL